MPVLRNPRHERFAQELAQGKSSADAYVAAGYKENRHNAHRLSTIENIRARVEEIQSQGADLAAVTLEMLIGYAQDARRLAMDISQPSAAVAAVKELGVLTGLRVEKRENTNRSASDLSDDDLARIAAGGSAGASAPAGGSKLAH